MARKNGFLVVKLFDLCYSGYAWDSLSKSIIVQFNFNKTIVAMQKATANMLFFRDKGLFSQSHFLGTSSCFVILKMIFLRML